MLSNPRRFPNGSTGDPSGPEGQATPHVLLALDELHAARAVGVSKEHLAKLRRAGKVPHAKLGERIVYPIDVLRSFVNGLVQLTEAEADT